MITTQSTLVSSRTLDILSRGIEHCTRVFHGRKRDTRTRDNNKSELEEGIDATGSVKLKQGIDHWISSSTANTDVVVRVTEKGPMCIRARIGSTFVELTNFMGID